MRALINFRFSSSVFSAPSSQLLDLSNAAVAATAPNSDARNATEIGMELIRSFSASISVMIIAHLRPARLKALLALVTQIPTSRAVSDTERNGTKLFPG